MAHPAEQRRQEKTIVPESVFNAFLDANMKYPQSVPGIVAYVGKAFWESGLSPQEFARTELSDNQVRTLGNAMDSIHQEVGVRQFSENHVSDKKKITIPKERLQGIWIEFRLMTLLVSIGYSEIASGYWSTTPDFMNNTEGALAYRAELFRNHEKLAAILDELLAKDEKLIPELKTLFGIFVDVLDDPPVAKQYEKLHSLLDFRNTTVFVRVIRRIRRNRMRLRLQIEFSKAAHKRMRANKSLRGKFWSWETFIVKTGLG